MLLNCIDNLTVLDAFYHYFCPDIDNCDPYPCSNNGVCEDGIDFFSCYCPSGFSGDLCEIGKWSSVKPTAHIKI